MIRIVAVIAALAQIATYTVTAQSPFSFRVVASGLSMPWEVVWGPDDQLCLAGRHRGATRNSERPRLTA